MWKSIFLFSIMRRLDYVQNKVVLFKTLDLEHELKVADEFWDFLGGEGAYQDLLSCFEKVGIELRPEIDQYFARFRNKIS